MNLHPLIILITGFLSILWAYASFSKLFDFKQFKHAMLTQAFPRWMGHMLIYIVPAVEIAIIILLIIPQTRLSGMYASAILMLLFTLYIGGEVFKIYGRHPCACGGLFIGLGWHNHFKLNILLTLIAMSGLILMEI